MRSPIGHSPRVTAIRSCSMTWSTRPARRGVARGTEFIPSSNHPTYAIVAAMRVEHREPELDGVVATRTPGVVAAGMLLTVAVVLTALNLRPAITGVGPMLAEMR